jgi:monofunctional biosynthetic peptidoglycan transglycosylase
MVALAMSSPGFPRRRRLGLAARVSRAFVLLVATIVLLPYLITPLYLVLPPVSTPMLWRFATGQPVARTFVPLDAISAALPLTVIAAEDARFCSHAGIDWTALRDMIEETDEFGDLRGVSTITQQTAKNLFLWPGRSYLRKALELPLSLWLDLVLPKRRILEIYLNVAEWGPNGEFGAEAGSRRAFAKSARDLSWREAALLAAILPNPVRRDARQPGPAVRRLAALHESRAVSSPSLGSCLRTRRSP